MHLHGRLFSTSTGNVGQMVGLGVECDLHKERGFR